MNSLTIIDSLVNLARIVHIADNSSYLHYHHNTYHYFIHISTGSLLACKIIVEIGGYNRVHDRDNQDRTVLHLATMGGHGDVVNYLLDKGGKFLSNFILLRDNL